jgi:hypothetical protein
MGVDQVAGPRNGYKTEPTAQATIRKTPRPLQVARSREAAEAVAAHVC